MITDDMEELLRPQQIHITTLEVPVSYQAVLSITPGLHGRPPVLPRPNDPSLAVPPPPANGYDFIFHVGVAGRGPLRIERIGHKNGYRMKDKDGEYAPIVHLPKDPIGDTAEAELQRMERMLGPPHSLHGPNHHGPEVPEVVDIPPPPNRGFGKGYEQFADELSTEVDVPKLIVHLKESGIDVSNPSYRRLTYADFTDGTRAVCSRSIPPWMQATIFVTSSSTAPLQKRSGGWHRRRSLRSAARLRRRRLCFSCTSRQSISHSARNR